LFLIFWPLVDRNGFGAPYDWLETNNASINKNKMDFETQVSALMRWTLNAPRNNFLTIKTFAKVHPVN
jgi:hypothetical protein